MRDILKYMNVSVDGIGMAGLASAVEVPKPQVATRDFSAGGMGGPIKVRMARLEEALTAKITFEGFEPTIYKSLDVNEGTLLPLTARGSAQDDDGTTHAHLIQMRGFVETYDEGEWKDGENVPLKVDMSLRYYRRVRDEVELIEYDPVAMILKVNGKDLLKQHRLNIGL